MRSLPEPMPKTDRRFVWRVPQQPYLRFDTNDYSLDPPARRPPGRGARLPDRDLGGGARHRRARLPPPPLLARQLTFTAPAHQAALDALRGARRRGPEVELRPLARYDALIPA
jgi:hypothetical protein